jgi:hypothetical protein
MQRLISAIFVFSAAVCAVCWAAVAAVTVNPHVVIVSPLQGQIFAPGEHIDIVLRVDPPLHAADAGIIFGGSATDFIGSPTDFSPSTTALNRYDPLYASTTGLKGPVYHWLFTLPPFTAGTLTLTPMIATEENPKDAIQGALVTVGIQPKEAPLRIEFADHFSTINPEHPNYVIDPGQPDLPKAKPQTVTGIYSQGRRNLTSALSGTTYHVDAPQVISVDAEGYVTAIGPGFATVTAENHGVKDSATFVVEDPAHPLPPQDVTAKLKIKESPPVTDATEKAYGTQPLLRRDITITNVSSSAIPGRLFLHIYNLPEGVKAWKGASEGGEWLEPKDGFVFHPGEQIKTAIYFLTSSASLPATDKLVVMRSHQAISHRHHRSHVGTEETP